MSIFGPIDWTKHKPKPKTKPKPRVKNPEEDICIATGCIISSFQRKLCTTHYNEVYELIESGETSELELIALRLLSPLQDRPHKSPSSKALKLVLEGKYTRKPSAAHICMINNCKRKRGTSRGICTTCQQLISKRIKYPLNFKRDITWKMLENANLVKPNTKPHSTMLHTIQVARKEIIKKVKELLLEKLSGETTNV